MSRVVTFTCLSSTITMTVDESIPMTPSRRSKRFQPLVTPVKTDAFTDKSAVWTDDGPFYIRPTVLEDYQVLQDEGWQPNPQMQTAFRKSFQRNKSTAPVSRKARKPRTEAVEIETFEVGDTVLVKTQFTRNPSVGVIASMWEFQGGDDREDDESHMLVRIHWFQHPSELPRIRAKREHFEVSETSTNCHPLTPTTRTKCTLHSLHKLFFRRHVYYHTVPSQTFPLTVQVLCQSRANEAAGSPLLRKKVHHSTVASRSSLVATYTMTFIGQLTGFEFSLVPMRTLPVGLAGMSL